MLNLTTIFQEQDRLNKETAAKHEEYSRLTKDGLTQLYVFAALCELGEMSNEWGDFKIWKTNRKQHRVDTCPLCKGEGIKEGEKCSRCGGVRVYPLLEEYIDVVHFCVSVAIGFNLDPLIYKSSRTGRKFLNPLPKSTYHLILKLYQNLVYANVLIEESEKIPPTQKSIKNNQNERQKVAVDLLDTLWQLGYSLGFSDSDIEKAYFSKNQINQIRQEENY